MTIVTCFNFAEAFCFATGWPGASGDLEKWDGIQYVDDNDLCIDHLQHTEAEVIENGTWLWNQQIKKVTKAEKDAFMKWQRSR